MWQRWLRLIRNFFGFTRGEARGFSVMLLLLILVYLAWFLYSLMPADTYNPATDQRQLDSLISLLEAADTAAVNAIAAEPDRPENTTVEAEGELFHFNPNLLSLDSLELLGFPPFLAQRLHNYRAKGGVFRKEADLLKLYGMPQPLYERLRPWIRIPPQAQLAQKNRKPPVSQHDEEGEKPKAVAEPFDLNTADSLQLIRIRGIGPVLSSRILKFRDGLGGFAQAEQVREVWGLPPETADLLLQQAYVKPGSSLRQLNINTAEAEALSRHPYISPRQASLIVAYRSQNGSFKQAEDLLRIHMLDENFVNKLKPYLVF